MEIRVSKSDEAPGRIRSVELFSPVRKPSCKVEEMDDITDFDGYGFCLMKDELFEIENVDVNKRIIKSVFMDDKEELIVHMNRLMQNIVSGRRAMDEERVECIGIVSKLLRLCCLFDSVKCATALLNGEVLGVTPLVNEMDESGLSALHTAATVHAVKCIEVLLSKNARTDIKSKDERSQVALELSLSSRRMEVVWKVGDPIEDLLVCLNQKNLGAVQLLAEKTNEIGQVAYSVAITGQPISLAALLMVASEKVMLPVVDLQTNGDLGSKDNVTIYDCLLNEAIALGRDECSSLSSWSTHLSRTFRRMEEFNDSAECFSMRRKLLLCEMELCQLFGAAPAPRRSLEEKKAASALIYAIQAADLEVVQLLLETGVKLGETDDQGNSALHWALKLNSALCLKQIKIIELLLQHGARVTQKNKLGLTPLHIAASNGNFQAIQILLLEEPNSVHAVTEMKETPLFLAVKNDHRECVELLLRSGANSEVLNIRKQRPIDFAKSQDIRFILNPTNIGFLHHTHHNKQKVSVDAKGVPRESCSILSTLRSQNTIAESLQKTEPCKYFKSLHGCARGAKCFFGHDEEHGLFKRERQLNCLQSSELRRKIFVGGLPASVDSESLGKYFEHFGSVEDALVVETLSSDQSHSRGFGFITFKNEKSVTVAVQAHYILIMGKKVEIKSCLPRSPPSEPVKVQPEIEQEYVNLGLQTLNVEVESPVENNLQKKSWVDKLFHNRDEISPLDVQTQVSHSSEKGKEPEWLRVFRKWFPSFMKKKFKFLEQGEFYALSSLKADFRATCGFELDHSSIGYSKLSEFLVSITDMCRVDYVPGKGRGSASHMVLLPNRFTPKKSGTEPMKSPDAHSQSETSGNGIDGCLEDSKFVKDGVPLSADTKVYEVSDSYGSDLFQYLFSESSSSSLDHKGFDAIDDLVKHSDHTIQPVCQSYKDKACDSNDFTVLPDLKTPLDSLSSEDKVLNLSTNFLLQDLWLEYDQTCSPCSGSTSVMKAPIQVDHMELLEDKNFLQFLSPDPIFGNRPWVKNESYCGAQSADVERHYLLEDFARRNSTSIFFLREFDFYMKYSQCLREEKCFSCNKQRMSWANYPCQHLLWCDECRNDVVNVVKGSEHKCIICDTKVQKLLHNYNPTSWSKLIQPRCLSIMDHKEFPSLDVQILKSPSNSGGWKMENVSKNIKLNEQADIGNVIPLAIHDCTSKDLHFVAGEKNEAVQI